jgi:hypothetical protein
LWQQLFNKRTVTRLPPAVPDVGTLLASDQCPKVAHSNFSGTIQHEFVVVITVTILKRLLVGGQTHKP